MRTEAAITTGSITAAVTALIALGVAFGLDLDPDQQAAILAVVGVLAPLVVAVVTRNFVWSQKSVEDKIAATARAASQGTSGPTSTDLD